jgi:hypothetical protein
MLNKISEFCEENAEAEIGGIHVEIVPMGKPVGDLFVPREDWQLPEAWQAEDASQVSVAAPRGTLRKPRQ